MFDLILRNPFFVLMAVRKDYVYIMNKIFSKIKWMIEIIFNIKLFFVKKSKTPKIVLLLTPQYLNFGDHGIAVEERKILKKLYPQKQILEINYSFYQFWSKKVQKIIKNEDVIVITGGGYMGDLWPQLQATVNHIIKTYKNNRIILAPQTIFYKNSDGKNLEQFKHLLTEHGNVFIYARENNTLELLTEKMHFIRGTQCDLAPDLVLLLNVSQMHIKKQHRNGVGLCIRDDCERNISKSNLEEITKTLSAKYETVHNIKMAYGHVEIPVWISSLFVKKKLKQYADKRFIVTDRLHGMVFAAITGTPCIVFDNVSKKISGVYKWIETLDYVNLVTSTEEFKNVLEQMESFDYDHCKRQLSELQNRLEKEYIPKIDVILKGQQPID